MKHVSAMLIMIEERTSVSVGNTPSVPHRSVSHHHGHSASPVPTSDTLRELTKKSSRENLHPKSPETKRANKSPTTKKITNVAIPISSLKSSGSGKKINKSTSGTSPKDDNSFPSTTTISSPAMPSKNPSTATRSNPTSPRRRKSKPGSDTKLDVPEQTATPVTLEEEPVSHEKPKEISHKDAEAVQEPPTELEKDLNPVPEATPEKPEETSLTEATSDGKVEEKPEQVKREDESKQEEVKQDVLKTPVAPVETKENTEETQEQVAEKAEQNVEEKAQDTEPTPESDSAKEPEVETVQRVEEDAALEPDFPLICPSDLCCSNTDLSHLQMYAHPRKEKHAIKLAVYKSYLKLKLDNALISLEDKKELQMFRRATKIRDDEHEELLKNLGWDEDGMFLRFRPLLSCLPSISQEVWRC